MDRFEQRVPEFGKVLTDTTVENCLQAHANLVMTAPCEIKEKIKSAACSSHHDRIMTYVTSLKIPHILQWLLDLFRHAHQINEFFFHNTLLLDAALHGHFAVVKWICCNNPASVLERDSYGNNAAILACSRDHNQIVKWLLEPLPLGGGAVISTKGRSDTTVFLTAVKRNNIELVKWFFQRREQNSIETSVHKQLKCDFSTLQLAVSLGHLEMAQYFVEKTEIYNSYELVTSGGMVHTAVLHNQLDTLKWLLTAKPLGAVLSPSNVDGNGNTFQHLATTMASDSIIKWAFTHCTNINIHQKTKANNNLLHLIVLRNDLQLLITLMNTTSFGSSGNIEIRGEHGQTCLLLAAKCNYVALMQWMLLPRESGGGGANINTLDENNISVFFYAVKNNNLEMLKMLSKHNGGCNKIVIQGNVNLLMVAARHGHEQMMAWMLSQNPDFGNFETGWKDTNGATFLMYLALGGHLKLLQRALKYQYSNKIIAVNDGRILLQHAVYGEDIPTVAWLLSSRYDSVSTVDDNNVSVLMYAVQRGCNDLVEWLLKNKPSRIDERDDKGFTAMAYLDRSKHFKILNTLLQYTCELTWTNTDVQHWNPMSLFLQNGNEDMLRHLISRVPSSILSGCTCRGVTPLTFSACLGRYKLVEILFNSGIVFVDKKNEWPLTTMWKVMKVPSNNNRAFNSMLKFLTMLEEPPVLFCNKLSPSEKKLVVKGNKKRDLLPAYLKYRDNTIEVTSSLPNVLVSIISAYAEPSCKDIWNIDLKPPSASSAANQLLLDSPAKLKYTTRVPTYKRPRYKR
jgi:ankyrin repeat protein